MAVVCGAHLNKQLKNMSGKRRLAMLLSIMAIKSDHECQVRFRRNKKCTRLATWSVLRA